MGLRQLHACPFELGTTLKGTDADGNLICNEVLGGVWTFNNITTTSPTNGVRSFHTREPLVCMAVRNRSGVTLYGKRLVTFDITTAGLTGITDIKGYADTLFEKSAPLDEFIATNGVADKDICWVVIEGVCTLMTPEVNTNMNGDIAAGADLIAATAASSTGSTTGGRVSNVTFFNATAGETGACFRAYNLARGLVATALSAKTTDNTSADILCRVRARWLQ